MKYEGDEALVTELLNKDKNKESFTFESHWDYWVTCKVCKKTSHTSMFFSDAEKFKKEGIFPEYLSDNGKSLLTDGTCIKCKNSAHSSTG